MDIDNEAVDWGYDDDLPPVSRNSSYEQVDQVGHGDADDVEDYVSLGEDDEDQGYFYQHQNLPETDPSTNVAQATKEDSERPHSAQARDDTTGANNATRARYRSREDDRGARSRNRGRRISSESPYRRESSNRHASPQRSQQNSARITHALPPKPSTQVFYIPPSHSSKIEAVGMTSLSPPSRSAIREGKKSNGASTKRDISPDISDHRERRYPRQGADIPNHNREFPETSRNIPVSNTSTSNLDTSQSRRRRASPSGNMPLIPNSNASHSQTSRSHRERQYSRPENGREDLSRPSSPGANGLSYKDRHYVPSSNADVRMVDRPEDVPLPSKSRYDRSPSSPPRQRRRPRSISPLPDDIRGSNYPSREKGYDSFRGSERLRGRDGIINEPDTMREAPQMSHDAGRRWSAPRRGPPVDVARDERGLRVPPDRPPHEDYTYDQRYIDDRNRPDYKRRDSSHGPEREREPEHARPSERTTRRERPIDNQDFIPSLSTLSASYPPPIAFVSTPAMFTHSSSIPSGCMAGVSCFSFISCMRQRPRCSTSPLSLLDHPPHYRLFRPPSFKLYPGTFFLSFVFSLLLIVFPSYPSFLPRFALSFFLG
ncbi:hypothetical protein CPC08DRAFT_101213 [Agrocybe pediades]|nr:hypothetical protein CPC08DRAFT_101213 [Agrocybe pediades]